MKKLLSTAALAVALLLGIATPAGADSASVAPVIAASVSATPASGAPFLNGYGFWTPAVCMAVGDQNLTAPELAQQWNVQSGHVVKIQAENNCVTHGYTPSRRFTLESYSGSTSRCIVVTDKNGGDLYPGADTVIVGGTEQYLDNPIAWVNRECWTSIYNQRHWTSAAIGQIMGLQSLYSTSYNSRVVNHTAWSRTNIQYADVYSAGVLARFYS